MGESQHLWSKGLGRIQRVILALIEAEPEGAWPYEELCRLVYPGVIIPTRSQLSAIGRALKPLPGTWGPGYGDGNGSGRHRRWLYDEGSLESTRKAHLSWHKDNFEPGGAFFNLVERTKRTRTS
jgi:hypothetical protein